MDRQELGQLLNLKIELIPEGNPNRSGRAIAPDFITIHNTSNPNPGADANAHSRFVREKGFYVLSNGKRNDVSWHYTVDDKRAIKHLPVNERAIHAGRGNGVSVAIEVCMHQGIDQAAANLRAARLVAVLMHDLKIPKSNVKSHKFWTNKACPTLLLNGFDGFCQTAAGIVDSLEPPGIGAQAESISPSEGPVVTEDEIAAIKETRNNPIEAEVAELEDDPDEAHDLIAAEVQKTIEGK